MLLNLMEAEGLTTPMYQAPVLPVDGKIVAKADGIVADAVVTSGGGDLRNEGVCS